MRSIGVVTTARADYGIYLPILRRIEEDPDLHLHLMVSGMHLSPEFGLTINSIREDGFEIGDQVEMLLSSDTPEGIVKSMGLGLIGFAQSFSRFRPDILVVLGDRFEMHTVVVASLPFRIPVAHIHGGESTEGLIDEQIRHSITKMSHLHFPSTEFYAKRIIQMGEEPCRVVVSGAPSIDNLYSYKLFSRNEIKENYGFDLVKPALIVTYHPVTLEYEHTKTQMIELLQALDETNFSTIIFTYPNADTSGRLIIEMITDFVAKHERAHVATNLGTKGYFSLMQHATAMVGNSSSGIIEAASFKLPVVNIGNRQRGRICGKNVIHVGNNRQEIHKGIKKALSPEFKTSLNDLINHYGDGHASERIVQKLKEITIDETFIFKSFYHVE